MQRYSGLNSNLTQKLPTLFQIKNISTGTNTVVKIKFNNVNSWAFLFGRNTSSLTIGACLAYAEVVKIGTAGSFTVENGVITCKLGQYAMGFLLHSANVESIEYS